MDGIDEVLVTSRIALWTHSVDRRCSYLRRVRHVLASRGGDVVVILVLSGGGREALNVSAARRSRGGFLLFFLGWAESTVQGDAADLYVAYG